MRQRASSFARRNFRIEPATGPPSAENRLETQNASAISGLQRGGARGERPRLRKTPEPSSPGANPDLPLRRPEPERAASTRARYRVKLKHYSLLRSQVLAGVASGNKRA